MNRRPLSLVCIGLMIAIWICRLTGVPVFGFPPLSESDQKALRSGRVLTVSGTILDRQSKTSSMQYMLGNATAAFRGRTIHLGQIRVTATNDTSLNPEEEFSSRTRNRRAASGRSAVQTHRSADSDYASIPISSKVYMTGTVSRIESAGNPGQFDSAAYYACDKIFYEMIADSVSIEKRGHGIRETLLRLREKMHDRLFAVMHEESAGVLSAMLLGDRADLSEEIRLNYQCGGVMHVLAISGMHITLLGMALYRLLQRMFLILCGRRRMRPGRIFAGLTAAVVMGFYCVFAGSPVSAVRAYLMFVILLGARASEKSYDLPDALALAGILLLLEKPGYLFYAGFQLSFAAVLGAGLFCPAFLTLIPNSFWDNGSRKKRILEKLLESILSWTAITAVTLPLICYYFYEFPVFGLITNLAVLPLMSMLMELGFAGCVLGLVSKYASWFLLIPVDAVLQGIALLTGKLRALPLSVCVTGQPSIPRILLYYLLLALLLLFLRKSDKAHRKNRDRLSDPKSRKAPRGPAVCGILLAGLLILFAEFPAEFSLTMLDVGQGDALAIQNESGTVFLVDGGSTSEKHVGRYRLIPYLKQQGISEIEGIFLTHADADHRNGVEELLDAIAEKATAIRVKKILLPLWMKTAPEAADLRSRCEAAGVPVLYLARGSRVRAGGLTFTVLHPFQNGGEQAGNSGSLVLHLSFQDFDALLTGDLEREGETEVLPLLSDVDCLKVAHHGSRYSTSIEFLEKTDPEICLISAPEDSPYGHPHKETLTRIRESGASAFCTRDCGAIRITVKNGRASVRCWKTRRRRPQTML